MGTSPEVEADIYTATLAPGDGVLLCSDGLYRLVEEEEMERGHDDGGAAAGVPVAG